MTESEYNQHRYRREVVDNYLNRPRKSPDDQLIIKSKHHALQDYLKRPFPSTDDPPPFKTHVFDHYIGVTYREKYPRLVRELPRPGVFSLVNKIDDIGREIRSTIIDPITELFRPRVDLEKINTPQTPIEPPTQRIDLEQK